MVRVRYFMKIYQIRIDTMLLTIIAEIELCAFNLLKNEDSRAFIENGNFKYKWDENYIEDFTIDEIPLEEGIIQWESH